jgi:hypothetical protein
MHRMNATTPSRWLRTTMLVSLLALTNLNAAQAVPALAGLGPAATCQRLVGIEPQLSAGEGAGTVTLAVHTGGCLAAGSVRYTVVSGTAQENRDFAASSGTVDWNAGDDSPRRIGVALLADTEPEPDLEDLTVRLSTPSSEVSIVGGTGQMRILDDDGGFPVWAVDDHPCDHLLPSQRCVCEEQLMGDPFVICVVELHLSAPIVEPLRVEWRTVDGTARADVDYVGVEKTVTELPAGVTTGTVRIQLLPRPPGTPARWFAVELVGVSAGVVADAVGLVTIPAG